MSVSTKASDWQCIGVATIGGAILVGAAGTMFQFRSKKADFLGEYLFVGGALGLGESLSGAVAPSPSDFVNKGRDINLWSNLKVSKSFSSDDLSNCTGAIASAGLTAGYGYSVVFISAGLFERLFDNVYVGGWGVGLGLSGSIVKGMWIRLSSKNYY